MVSKLFATEQVMRFSGLDYFPSEPQAIEELVSVVMTAKSEEVCRHACSSIISTAIKCPKPVEVSRELNSAGELPWSPDWKLPTDLCQNCQSLGYIERDGVFVACPLCENGLNLPDFLLVQLNRKPPCLLVEAND
jgi:hypothetical protein